MHTKDEFLRVSSADALRGFALFGILIVNISSFVFTYDLSEEQQRRFFLAQYDGTCNLLINMFFTGKFYSIFCLLFGWSFSLFLAKHSGTTGLSLYKRRLVMLLFFGLVHLLLWEGDILFLYALLGFLLIPLRKWKNYQLLILAAICILSPIGWYASKMNFPALDLSNYVYDVGYYIDSFRNIADENALMFKKQSNFFDMLSINVSGIFYRYGYLLYTSRIWKVLGMFALGVVVSRTEVFSQSYKHRKWLWMILLAGLLIGLPANYYLAVFMKAPGYYQRTTHGLLQTLLFSIGVVPLALAYCAGFLLLYTLPGIRKSFSPFAKAGKMALTNYILQTILCIYIFSGFGLNVHYVSKAVLVILSAGLFCIQVLLSVVWLHFFTMGPLEWLWRSATYKKLLPILKK